MTFVPHFRLSMIGTMPGDEIFSCNLSLIPDNAAWPAVFDDAMDFALWTAVLDPDGDNFGDLVADCQAFWSREATGIHTTTVLRKVKLAAIGSDGLYIAAPAEALVTTPGTGAFSPFPNQVARKVTLHTDGDLKRVKGGFYLPGATLAGFDQATQLYSTAITDAAEDSAKQFLDAVENVPGIDAESWTVVVASQGRHNKDGSVRRPPTNHGVTGVSIGRRADVQRRRSNRISEARGIPLALADN